MTQNTCHNVIKNFPALFVLLTGKFFIFYLIFIKTINTLKYVIFVD